MRGDGDKGGIGMRGRREEGSMGKREGWGEGGGRIERTWEEGGNMGMREGWGRRRYGEEEDLRPQKSHGKGWLRLGKVRDKRESEDGEMGRTQSYARCGDEDTKRGEGVL